MNLLHDLIKIYKNMWYFISF